MLQEEFTKRTGVVVDAEEYAVIDAFYMSVECDKDEFCRMWCRMNASRVTNAKIERQLKARDEAYRDALYKFYTKHSDMNEFMTPIWEVKISTYEIQALSYAGICVAGEDGSCKYLSDIRYEIGQYLGLF